MMAFKAKFSKLVRGLMLLGLLAVEAVLCPVNAAETPQQSGWAKATTAGQPDISGVWVVTNFTPKGVTLEGKEPPLQSWARDIYHKRLDLAQHKGLPFTDTEVSCLSAGMPRMMMGAAYPVQILQTAGQVTILFELIRNVRYIFLTDKHPDPADIDPSFNGDSIGRWEGDTLIVDTIGLTDRTTVDKYGIPHTDALHVLERIHRTGKDTLEDLMTIEDPKTFTAPWQYRAIYKRASPGTRIGEYMCENNRNLPDQNGNITFRDK
jgi:hypothetical protein